MTPRLIVLGGLPSVGKTTLARAAARRLGAIHLRIDSIEQALRDAAGSGSDVGATGYVVAYRIAADNLALGHTVIADSVNPLPVTREAWQRVSRDASASLLEVEVVCSDPGEHRRRVESRTTDIEGLVLPTWEDVVSRNYAAWPGVDVVIDTAGRSADACVTELLAAVGVGV